MNVDPLIVEKIQKSLSELQIILREQGENNWIRGVTDSLNAIQGQDGFYRARSIYASMLRGVGSFADYNIWINDFDSRKNANARLDELRDSIWKMFDL